MKQQTIQIQKPLENTKDVIELPKTQKLVKAKTLLEQFEQKLIPSGAVAFFTILYQDSCYLVKPHDMVPHDATVQRTSQHGLLGFGAIASG